jgi:hypothetical protein
MAIARGRLNSTLRLAIERLSARACNSMSVSMDRTVVLKRRQNKDNALAVLQARLAVPGKLPASGT